LFQPPLFLMKNIEPSFFTLADKFLSSRYLPSYVVAAFMKRLAHLALSAPPAGAMLSLVLIYNMLVQHTSCRVLLHRKSEITPVTPVLLVGGAAKAAGIGANIGVDPYIFDETDPAKCNAVSSSLWEVKALENHYHPAVSRISKTIEGRLQTEQPYLVSTYASATYQTLFLDELNTKTKVFPIDYNPKKNPNFTENDLFLGWRWQ